MAAKDIKIVSVDLALIEEFIHSFPERGGKKTMTGADSEVYLASFLLREIADRVEQFQTGEEILESVQNMYSATSKLKAVVKCQPSTFGEDASKILIEFTENIAQYLNETRDYEILMASLAGYCEEIPNVFADGRKGIREILRKRATVRRTNLTKYLKSAEFTESVATVCASLSELADGAADDGFTAELLADAKIVDAFYNLNKFVENGSESGTDIAKFRILCKKLGYMMELYGQFSGIKKLEKSAEKLQDIREVLSMNNNLTAQMKILESLASKLSGSELGAVAALLTIIGAIKNELAEELEEAMKSLSKKDKLLDIKKKKIKEYTPEHDEDEDVLF